MPFMCGKKPSQFEQVEPVSNPQILDETFECLHRTARSMCQTLGRPKDRMLCYKTLNDLAMYNKSESAEVKSNAHTFLRFYLKALRWTQINQPMLVYKKWFGDACDSTSSASPVTEQNEVHVWLKDGESYLAMKHFDDGSTMIYSAVSNDPSAGWVDGGLKKLVDQMEHS